MRILLSTAAVLLVTVAAPASAVVQRGESSEGARFTLSGRTVTIVLPSPLAPGATVRAACGRRGQARTWVGRGRGRGHGLRTVRVRLHVAPSGAEWCRYRRRGGGGGAAGLASGVPAPAPVQPGPGVREARTTDDDELDGSELEGDDGDARFLQRGAVLTVELRRAFPRSAVVDLVCGTRDRAIGLRAVAVRAGDRTVTADLEGDLSGARWCIVEEDAGDIAAASFP